MAWFHRLRGPVVVAPVAAMVLPAVRGYARVWRIAVAVGVGSPLVYRRIMRAIVEHLVLEEELHSNVVGVMRELVAEVALDNAVARREVEGGELDTDGSP